MLQIKTHTHEHTHQPLENTFLNRFLLVDSNHKLIRCCWLLNFSPSLSSVRGDVWVWSPCRKRMNGRTEIWVFVNKYAVLHLLVTGLRSGEKPRWFAVGLGLSKHLGAWKCSCFVLFCFQKSKMMWNPLFCFSFLPFFLLLLDKSFNRRWCQV